MSQIWNKEIGDTWWIEGAPYPPLLQQIREFINYRALHPHDDTENDPLRDLRGVFKAMNLEEDPHRNGASKPTSAGSGTTTNTDEGSNSTATFDLWAGLESSPEMNWDPPIRSVDMVQGEWS